MVDVAKSPLDDVETISESHDDGDCSESPEEEEPIPESHGDVVTATPEFPDDAIEEDLEKKGLFLSHIMNIIPAPLKPKIREVRRYIT